MFSICECKVRDKPPHGEAGKQNHQTSTKNTGVSTESFSRVEKLGGYL